MAEIRWPQAFLDLMRDQLGKEADAFFESLDSEPSLSILRNPNKPRCSDISLGAKVPWNGNGYFLDKRPNFASDPAWHAGTYYVMDASSMIIGEALRQHLPERHGMRLLDLCGAPGGKSVVISCLAGPHNLVVSNEIIRSRFSTLSENMIKWGNPSRALTNLDPEVLANRTGAYFDCVVVDAPCSGEGLFRKKPDAAEQWSLAHVRHCAARQRRILSAAVDLLKPGGILLYSTCTFNATENIDNCRWLTGQFPLASLTCNYPAEWGVVEVTNHDVTGYQCYPHRTQTEGFFFAVMQKRPSHDNGNPGNTAIEKRKKSKHKERSSALQIPEWVTGHLPEGVRIVESNNDTYNLQTEVFAADMEYFRKMAGHGQSGVRLGIVKGRDFIPSPDLALMQGFTVPEERQVQLDIDRAMQFLRREQIDPGQSGYGWRLVRYRDCNLGWIKLTQQGVKNYFPMEWRMRR